MTEYKSHTTGAVLDVSAAKLARDAVRASIKIETPESIRFQALWPEKIAKARVFMAENNIKVRSLK